MSQPSAAAMESFTAFSSDQYFEDAAEAFRAEPDESDRPQDTHQRDEAPSDQKFLASEQELSLIRDFGYLKGYYASFKARYDQCERVYEHVKAEMPYMAQVRAFEHLYDLACDGNREIVGLIGGLESSFGTLESFKESVAPAIEDMVKDIQGKVDELEPIMREHQDSRFGANKKSFKEACIEFLKTF